MPGQTYFIDPSLGDDSRSGLTPEQALKNYRQLSLVPGDRVLFKRGSVMRDALHTKNGSADGVITYGAFGSGPKPVFLGSAPANDAARWKEVSAGLWRSDIEFSSEVCNLIFNGGESCGNLRWNLADLKNQGEWHYTGHASRKAGQPSTITRDGKPAALFLKSDGNPAHVYRDIECALWAHRRLAGGQRSITFENLAFKNSGVHGYQDSHVRHVTIRDCDFLFIGGAVYDADHKIRFGNGIEFWDGASDIVVERCLFDKIYDSGVTHQGGETRNIPERIFFRDNLFIDNGMSAYESREPGKEIYFEHNTCIRAGGGFSMQGEAPPRQSEIYPQPMGHHVFIWRIDKGTQPGHVYIRNNIFFEAEFGAAIYSCIDPLDERTFVIDQNCYWQTSGSLLMKLNNRVYLPSEFVRYQQDTGHDARSIVADPLFVDTVNYQLHVNSPARGMGVRQTTRSAARD